LSRSFTNRWFGSGGFFPPFFFTLTLSPSDLRKGAVIAGSSGSGKSTLIQTLVHQIANKEPNSSIIIIDPHGETVEDASRMKILHQGERNFIYIDPCLDDLDDPQRVPTFSVLKNRNKKTVYVDRRAQQLIDVLKIIIDSEFSMAMNNLLKATVSTLLLKGNSRLSDLLEFMDDKTCDKYLNFAKKHLTNKRNKDFLENRFHTRSLEATKIALADRLHSVLSYYLFDKMLNSRSATVDIEKEMNRGSTLLFNLSGGTLGAEIGDITGRFILENIRAAALARQSIPKSKRRPVYVFIDEVSRFIDTSSKSIETFLKETRKYNVNIIFADQEYLVNYPPKTRRIIANNANVKIIGSNEPDGYKTYSNQTLCPMDDFKGLRQGVFHYHIRESGLPSIKAHAPDFLLNPNIKKRKKKPFNPKYFITSEQWAEIRLEQLDKYYAPISQDDETATFLTDDGQHETAMIQPMKKIEL